MRKCKPWTVAAALSLIFSAPVALAQSARGQQVPPSMQPLPAYKMLVLHNVMVPMRDGVRLAADVYIPSLDGATPAPGRFPALLIRTPYVKTNFFSALSEVATSGIMTPEDATRHGYVYVSQDVRGTSASEGKWEPMLNEGRDGPDTVAWLRTQSWSDGHVGTLGPSYLGGTQMLSAVERPEGLVTAFSQVAASGEFGNEWVFKNGALALGTASSWTDFVIGRPAPRLSDEAQRVLAADYAAVGADAPGALGEAGYGRMVNSLPLRDMPVVRNAPWWTQWLDHWNDPSYFRNVSLAGRFANFNIPILHMGGWYDLFLQNTLDQYVGISKQAKNPAIRSAQRLMIGPWTHSSCLGCARNASVDARAMQLAWMDQWLKGRKSGAFDHPIVLYVMGENRWRAEETWPLQGTKRTRYYLHSEGRANSAEGDGLLSTRAPAREAADHYDYDPRNPVPTLGGLGLEGSRAAQNVAEARPDLLAYTSPVLEQDVEVTGEVSATVYAASSARDTDWWVRLVDVAPDGKAYVLNQGVVRARYRNSRTDPQPLTPNKVEKYSVNMMATSNLFKKGHRIRVDIASSNFPYTDRNANAFVDLASATEKDFVVAAQTVYHEKGKASFVDLPIIPMSRSRNWIETPFPLGK